MEMKNVEDALMGFPGHDCGGFGRGVDEDSEVR